MCIRAGEIIDHVTVFQRFPDLQWMMSHKKIAYRFHADPEHGACYIIVGYRL